MISFTLISLFSLSWSVGSFVVRLVRSFFLDTFLFRLGLLTSWGFSSGCLFCLHSLLSNSCSFRSRSLLFGGWDSLLCLRNNYRFDNMLNDLNFLNHCCNFFRCVLDLFLCLLDNWGNWSNWSNWSNLGCFWSLIQINSQSSCILIWKEFFYLSNELLVVKILSEISW